MMPITERAEAIGRAQRALNARWPMLQSDEPSDYVLATGEGHTVRVLRCEVLPRPG